jgi:hypothetical protein
VTAVAVQNCFRIIADLSQKRHKSLCEGYGVTSASPLNYTHKRRSFAEFPHESYRIKFIFVSRNSTVYLLDFHIVILLTVYEFHQKGKKGTTIGIYNYYKSSRTEKVGASRKNWWTMVE